MVVLAIVAGILTYFNAWSIMAQILPAIERAERVVVSEPSAFTVPEGFSLDIYSADVPGARVMLRGPGGAILVSQPSEGKVSAVSHTGAVTTVIEGLIGPHGLAFVGSDLYIAEENAVKKYTYNPETQKAVVVETVAVLPEGGGHSTRTLLPSPNQQSLYVSIGSSCNVCDEDDVRRATVMEIDLATKEATVFARGLRNTVFMAHELITGDLWGTEMGRDLLGDDTPPDEVNVLVKGGNYGWPTCYGNNIHDTQFDTKTYIRNPCTLPFETPAKIELQAHSAPLGIAFVPEEGWPEEYWYDALVAYHGSWNRSQPTGYKVVRVEVDTRGQPTGVVHDFMTGFIKDGEEVIGRPVGLLAEPGGVLYVSDDRAGAIYRVRLLAEAR